MTGSHGECGRGREPVREAFEKEAPMMFVAQRPGLSRQAGLSQQEGVAGEPA